MHKTGTHQPDVEVAMAMPTWPENILTGIAANLLSNGLILAVIPAWLHRRQTARHMSNLLRPPNPQSGIIRHPDLAQHLQKPTSFRLLPTTGFRHPLPPEEAKTLRLFMDTAAGKPSWNGTLVRLDSIQIGTNGVELLLSRVGFHDLLTTNIAFAAGPQNTPLHLLARPALRPLVSQASALIAAYRTQVLTGIEPEEPTFDQVLRCPHLANAIAVALCLIDPNGHVLITERQRGLAVGSGTYTVAVTGSVSEADLTAENPITAACAREARQELDINIPPQHVRILDIVIAAEKLQPVALCVYPAQTPAPELASRAYFSQEAQLETKKLLTLDLNDPQTATAAILRANFSPTSRYLLWRLLTERHGKAIHKHYQTATKLWIAGWGIIKARHWLNNSTVWPRRHEEEAGARP